MPKLRQTFHDWYAKNRYELKDLHPHVAMMRAWRAGQEAAQLNSYLDMMDYCRSQSDGMGKGKRRHGKKA